METPSVAQGQQQPAAHGPVLGMQTPRSHPRIRIFIFYQMPRLFTGTLKYENR